jgi:hypothetical protein
MEWLLLVLFIAIVIWLSCQDFRPAMPLFGR